MANTNRLFSEIDSPVQRLSPDQDKGIRIYTGPVEIFFRIIGSKLSLLFGFGETIEKSDFLTHQFGCEVYVNKKSFQKFMSRHHVSAIQDTIQREAFLSKLLEIQQPSQQKASSAEIWRLARRLSTHEKASITDGWSKEDFLAWVRAAFPNRQDLEALSKQFQETPSSAEAIDQFQHGLQLLGNLPKAVILETVRKVHIEQPPSQPPKQATLEEELSRLTLKVEGEEPSLSRFRPTSFREIFDWIMLSDELSDSQKVPLLLLYVQQSQNLLTHKLTFKQAKKALKSGFPKKWATMIDHVTSQDFDPALRERKFLTNPQTSSELFAAIIASKHFTSDEKVGLLSTFVSTFQLEQAKKRPFDPVKLAFLQKIRCFLSPDSFSQIQDMVVKLQSF